MSQPPTKKPKAIITGIDQVITDANSWLEFLTEIGINLEKHRRIYSELRSGKIKWTDAKYELFDILKNKTEKVHKSRFDRSIGNIEVSGDAIATINELKNRGYIIGIISGSIDLIVEAMARWLKIEDWYANTSLTFDKNGNWIDIDYQQNEAEVKLEQAKAFLKKHHLKPEEVIVLGHSDADIELFKFVPGIAIKSKSEALKALAWEQISFFPRILQVLQRFE